MADNRKIGAQTDAISYHLSQLFTRAIKQALLDGLAVAVNETHHDSSNAAAHWMIGARANGGNTRPASRQLGKLKDLRGTNTQAPVYPVGYRGDGGSNKAQTLKEVRARELHEVLEDLLTGRRPETRFYFYNAAGGDDEYSDNAYIRYAGEQAVAATIASAERRIAAGATRKVPLK